MTDLVQDRVMFYCLDFFQNPLVKEMQKEKGIPTEFVLSTKADAIFALPVPIIEKGQATIAAPNKAVMYPGRAPILVIMASSHVPVTAGGKEEIDASLQPIILTPGRAMDFTFGEFIEVIKQSEMLTLNIHPSLQGRTTGYEKDSGRNTLVLEPFNG